jgi:hypothetical protein
MNSWRCQEAVISWPLRQHIANLGNDDQACMTVATIGRLGACSAWRMAIDKLLAFDVSTFSDQW